MTYDAYGIDVSQTKWKSNANIIFMDKWYLTTDYGKDTYRIYCEDNDLDPESDETKNEFVESYENETYCWNGLEALIVDYINDYDCNHNVVFRYEDCCICVAATIPSNNNEKDKMLTQEDIKNILTKYLTDLICENTTHKFEWLEISD